MGVVGNKCDLESQRAVTSMEAREFALSIGAAYIETSARTRMNVDECFHQLVREIRRAERPTTHIGNASPGKASGASLAKKQRRHNKKIVARSCVARVWQTA